MFIGKIMGGNWDENLLTIGDMPKDFILSARKIKVSELDEISELESLCKQLAEACQCTLTLFGVELEEGEWCGGFKQMMESALEAAKKAKVIP